MKNKSPFRRKLLPLLVAVVVLHSTGYATDVVQIQTAASDAAYPTWNTLGLWGVATTIGNSYFTSSTATGAASSNTFIGITVMTRIRDNGTVFGGDFLNIAPSTELLLKNNATTSTGNLVLNGGAIRFAPSGGISATLAGTINVNVDSYLGLSGTVAETLTVNSTITGNSVLHLAAGNSASAAQTLLTLKFNGDLSGFTGTFNLGGGTGSTGLPLNATLDFDQNYDLSLAGFVMGQSASSDILILDQNLTFGSFTFGATSLSGGSYTASDLNAMFGNGSQFVDNTGTFTLSVVPEPITSVLLLGGLGMLVLVQRRQRGFKQ